MESLLKEHPLSYWISKNSGTYQKDIIHPNAGKALSPFPYNTVLNELV